MRNISAVFLIFAFFMTNLSVAETATYAIKGMKCDECVKSVKAKVCNMKNIEKCDVKIGEVTLTTKADQKINSSEVEKSIEAAGNFSVLKSNTNKK